MKLIVGLGNPGPEYVWTRHNAGWLIIDSFVSRLSLAEPQMKFRGAFWGPVVRGSNRISLLKPYTFMNLSGLAVAEAVRYQNIELDDILIIYDDAALPFGTMRMRADGSAGGQKGMVSILGALQSLNVPRLRIGMGAPTNNMDMADWVLGRIPVKDRNAWAKVEDTAWDALKLWLDDGIQKAMSTVNGLRLISEEDVKKA